MKWGLKHSPRIKKKVVNMLFICLLIIFIIDCFVVMGKDEGNDYVDLMLLGFLGLLVVIVSQLGY